MSSPQHSTTAFVPGYVPSKEMTARDRESTAQRDLEEGQKWIIYEAFREDGRRKFDKKQASCLTSCWNGFWCLVPDVVEDAGAQVGKVLLKATVETVTLLSTVAKLDHKKLRNEINAILGRTMPTDLTPFQYNDETGKLPGRLTSSEMIYCARLSLLAYMTRDVHYHQFFPEHREQEMLDHLFSQPDEVHQVFLVEYACSLFHSEKENPRFAYSKGTGYGLKEMNLELVRPFDVKSTEGYIAKSRNFKEQGGDIVIAFQGTVDREDMMKNFHGTLTPFEPLWDRRDAGCIPCLQGTFCCYCCESNAQRRARNVKSPMGKVHVGFYNAFLSVKEIIQSTIEALLSMVIPDPNKKIRIVITGHSLGGALATLCTAWIMQWFRHVFPGGLPKNCRVLSVTFGQPKVGDDEFADAIDKDEWTNWNLEEGKNALFKTYRIFTPLDPVVTTPPVSLGFRHAYAMCMMDKGELYFMPQHLANQVDTTSEGIRRAIDQGMQIMSFHDLFNYLEAVMHFADNHRGEKDMEAIFGQVDYQSEVLADDFLTTF